MQKRREGQVKAGKRGVYGIFASGWFPWGSSRKSQNTNSLLAVLMNLDFLTFGFLWKSKLCSRRKWSPRVQSVRTVCVCESVLHISQTSVLSNPGVLNSWSVDRYRSMGHLVQGRSEIFHNLLHSKYLLMSIYVCHIRYCTWWVFQKNTNVILNKDRRIKPLNLLTTGSQTSWFRLNFVTRRLLDLKIWRGGWGRVRSRGVNYDKWSHE